MTETELLTEEQINNLEDMDLRREQLKQMVRLQACLHDFHTKLDATKKTLDTTREELASQKERLDRGGQKIEKNSDNIAKLLRTAENNSANVAIALKAAEVMLLKESTDRKLISTLDDVKDARERIENGVENADTEPPPDPDRVTLTENPRPTLPSGPPESEPTS